MAFFNQLLNYLWQILTFVGAMAAIGLVGGSYLTFPTM